ncbi:MAG: PaaX family transcriptional regulator C-terminal domain-containing protein [Lacisediminihabitans sp.]
MILDDFDSRPGSATSLLRTIVGACLRDLGGRASIAQLIRLLDAVGVSEAHARTAVLRVSRKGLLLPGGDGEYHLDRGAVPMLENGDRRIYTYRQMGDGDSWCLISFSIPETLRAERHQLRRRLTGIGCGIVSSALWICPEFLAGEVESILTDLGLRGYVTLFETSTPRPPGTLADAAAGWWDLPALDSLHRNFLDATAGFAEVEPSGSAAFTAWIRTLDEWRTIPYLDPGLPPSALPANWPGFASVARFEHLMTRFADAGRSFATSVPADSGARVR